MAERSILRIQMWGNSLAVRIPLVIARAAKFSAGQRVEVLAQDVGVVIVPVGPRNMTLAERLQSFDPKRHGGEVMATRRAGP
jgi:antitoxin MazE